MAEPTFRKGGVSTHIARHKRREERRVEAIERDEARAKRTAAQQLALVNTRPGASARERARLCSSSPA